MWPYLRLRGFAGPALSRRLQGCCRSTHDLDCSGRPSIPATGWRRSAYWGLGLRRAELAGIQIRDFDAQRGLLRVLGKGQKERMIPLRGPILAELRLMLSVDLPHVGRPPEGDDYLLYPVKRLAAGKGSEGQLLRTSRADPKKRPSPQSVHRWWYRHAQAAGLVGPGVTSGLNMHQARHTFAMELRRVAGIDAASDALGHADLNTTLGIYGHFDESDLEGAMEAYARWVAEQEA